MTNKALNRRTVLRGMLATGAAVTILPLLEIMLNESGTALAQTKTAACRRLCVTWFFGNGTLPGRREADAHRPRSRPGSSAPSSRPSRISSRIPAVISGLENKLGGSPRLRAPARDRRGPRPARRSAGAAVRAASIDQVVADLAISEGAPYRLASRVGVTPATPGGRSGLAAYSLAQGAQRAQQPGVRSEGRVQSIVS